MKSISLIIKPKIIARRPSGKNCSKKSIRNGLLRTALAMLLLGFNHAAFAQWQVQDQFVMLQEILQLQRMGDPVLIQNLTGADHVIKSLATKGLGIALDQLQKAADGRNALAYDGNGLYRTVPATIVTSDGAEHPRAVDDYRKIDAVNQSANNFNSVVADTERRRQELRARIRETTISAQAAATTAEVQKLQSILTAQNTELQAIDNERHAALGRVLVQDAQNRAQEQRDRQAKIEDQAAQIKAATSKVSQFLTPDAKAAQIPDPKTMPR